MNEVQVAIETHSANLERLRGIAKVFKLHAGNSYVDGLADHVQAVRSDARARAAAFPQQRIGLRRSITGNDVKRLIGFEGVSQFMEEVEYLRVNGFDFIDPEVASLRKL